MYSGECQYSVASLHRGKEGCLIIAVPFVRPLRPTSWSPIEWAGPLEGLTLRECHVTFLLCTLPNSIRAALLD
jgi:hypothetical protein